MDGNPGDVNARQQELAPTSDTEDFANKEEPADPVAGDIPAAEDTSSPDQPIKDDTAPDLNSTEQDGLTDDDDDYYGGDSSPGSSSSEDGGQEESAEIDRSARYELTYWPHHLQAVEKLWTRDERSTNASWKELWALVLKFLCGSPHAFQTWQGQYMSLPSYYDVEDVYLSPLQAAAAHGLTGTCEILIEHRESASAVTADGRSALWFAAEHSLELLKLLLDQGANPNSLGEYYTPFHRLIWLNPAIKTVKLMLDYNADCKLAGNDGLTNKAIMKASAKLWTMAGLHSAKLVEGTLIRRCCVSSLSEWIRLIS